MIFKEIDGNLFDYEDKGALMQCISADLKMGQGIALQFVRRFPQLRDEIIKIINDTGKDIVYNTEYSVKITPKSVTCSNIKDDITGKMCPAIINLITKKYYYNKPTQLSLEKSLLMAKNQCIDKGINDVYMPRIACGLDRMSWVYISKLIQQVFYDTEICITVVNYK